MSTPLADSSAPLRAAVVGGGVSGLSAAFRLLELAGERKQPLELTLFEASDRLGGVIETRQVEGYLVECGADSFITNKPWAVDLCRRLGIEDRLIPNDAAYRRSLVVRGGRPVRVPEGFMLLSPAKIWPVLTSPLFSPWGKLRMGLEYFIPRGRGDRDESLAAFVRRRFGREALDRLVQPLVGGIYTSDPERLSLLATMPRFIEMERRYGSLIRASRRRASQEPAAARGGSGARYGLFATPAGGLGELIEALASRVGREATIRRGTAVDAVERGAGGAERERWRLTLSDGSIERADLLVLSVGAPPAARLLEGVDGELAGSLRRIPHASSSIVVSGHRLADIAHPLDAFGLVVPRIEGRRILSVSFASRKFPGRAPQDRALLRTFVGGATQPELAVLPDEELKGLVREELAAILGVRGEPDFEMIARYPNAMPQYHVGHLEVVGAIESRLAEHPGLAVAGNAFHGVGIPDCVRSGERAAESLLAPARRGP